MRSQRKTTVAVLRLLLGLGVREFAELISKSGSTVTKLETGILPLSERTAQKIMLETGVALQWLLDGDPQEPPYSLNPSDHRKIQWTRAIYESRQAAKRGQFLPGGWVVPLHVKGDFVPSLVCAFQAIIPWISVFHSACKNPDRQNAALAVYLMREFIVGLEKRFGCDDEWVLKERFGIVSNGSRWSFSVLNGNLVLSEQTKVGSKPRAIELKPAVVEKRGPFRSEAAGAAEEDQ
jgi:transcriptional regulator with XRE-family HTH domain